MIGLTRSPKWLLVVAATIFALTTLALAPSVSAFSPRLQGGDLHLVKECPLPGNTGLAGSYCVITASNLPAIPVGSKVIYFQAYGDPTPGWTHSDVALVAGPGNYALGHIDLNQTTPPPRIGVGTFSGGTGEFAQFHANVTISCSPVTNPSPPPAAIPHCTWDGTYSSGQPLAATLVGVASLSAQRQSGSVLFVWRMWGQEQVRGFQLYANNTHISRGLISVHASLTYKRRVYWSGHGPFGLGVVFADGQQITIFAPR
jgi:hypothetical protein